MPHKPLTRKTTKKEFVGWMPFAGDGSPFMYACCGHGAEAFRIMTTRKAARAHWSGRPVRKVLITIVEE